MSSTFILTPWKSLQIQGTGKYIPSRKQQSYLVEETKVGVWGAKAARTWRAKSQRRKPQGREPEMLSLYFLEVFAIPKSCVPGEASRNPANRSSCEAEEKRAFSSSWSWAFGAGVRAKPKLALAKSKVNLQEDHGNCLYLSARRKHNHLKRR